MEDPSLNRHAFNGHLTKVFLISTGAFRSALRLSISVWSLLITTEVSCFSGYRHSPSLVPSGGLPSSILCGALAVVLAEPEAACASIKEQGRVEL